MKLAVEPAPKLRPGFLGRPVWIAGTHARERSRGGLARQFGKEALRERQRGYDSEESPAIHSTPPDLTPPRAVMTFE